MLPRLPQNPTPPKPTTNTTTMPKPPIQTLIPHLRRRFFHHLATTPPPQPPLLKPHFLSSFKPNPIFSNPFSTQTPLQNDTQIAQSLSLQLLKPSLNPTLSQSLDLSFSHITLTPSLIHHTLNLSHDAGRSIIDFLKWVSSESRKFNVSDEVYSFFVDYFGRRKDFKAVHDVMLHGKGVVGLECFKCFVDRIVRAGRAKDVVELFDRMENEYGIRRDRDKYNVVVVKLCELGFASCAEKMVKSLANEFFPDPFVCDMLIKGWCVDGKLEEAKRLAREMYRGGFEIGTVGYNAILDCVCKLCRVKDPFRIDAEVQNLLVDMDAAGVPRDTETFNVLITNLCKLRRTEDAIKLFSRMGEWGCSPDATTFVVLTRSLYQAARVGEGDEMIDRMKSAGYGDVLDKKAYYGFLKILCGIERIDHALTVFAMMNKDGCKPGVKTYELLIGKLHAHGRVEKANALSNEAARNGVEIEPKVYKLDPRFEKKPTLVKRKKRLTLPEKTALKRKRLRKLRLSFVKKPKKTMRRAF